MVEKIAPKKDEVRFITKNTMLHILAGTGGIEIDFKVFHDWGDKLIFLEKGQYIKFLSEDFVIRKIDFEDQQIFENKDFRVLFKHLVSIGYVHFDECLACQEYLASAIFTQPDSILDISSKQWFWQNPFQAKSEEYHLIFDVKEVVDQQFKNHLSNIEIADLLKESSLNPHKLYAQKVGITIKSLLTKKRLVESQKEVAFGNQSIKEISYEHGFKDPAYFNRVFKQATGTTPREFRDLQAYQNADTFIQDIYELITLHHQSEHQVAFYADEMNLSVKSLSRKTRQKLHTSIGQLIRVELIKSAKQHLKAGESVKSIAQELHFEEPNHFTSFFKHYTGITPTEYMNRKVQ